MCTAKQNRLFDDEYKILDVGGYCICRWKRCTEESLILDIVNFMLNIRYWIWVGIVSAGGRDVLEKT